VKHYLKKKEMVIRKDQKIANDQDSCMDTNLRTLHRKAKI
jgi:hypothetical protein